jgi:hypothetical protein
MPTTWETLTTRQQVYLKAAFDLDQAAEQAKAESFRYDRIVDSRPASVWRWIPFVDVEAALGRLPGKKHEERAGFKARSEQSARSISTGSILSGQCGS